MEWSGEAIVCAVQRHGDSGAIVRLLTADAGLIAGYVRGGQSRRLKAHLMPGNRIIGQWRARVDDQLGHLAIEPSRSIADVVLTDPLAAAGIGWITALAAVAMPDRQPYVQAHGVIAGLIDAAMNGAVGHVWAGSLAHAELVMLQDLGFGLDLASCAATGQTQDLAYVSPRSAQAVSRVAGAAWHDRLLPLPRFLLTGDDAPDWEQAQEALNLSGHFIAKHLLEGRAGRIGEARGRLMALVDSRRRP